MSRVVAEKTEPKCKVCRSAFRDKVDELLLLRSERKTDGNGVKVNLDYLVQRCTSFGIDNPTKENLQTHFKKHCRVVDEVELQEKAEVKEAVVRGLQEHIASGKRLDPDAALDWLVAQGMTELELRVEETGKAGITVDQLLKAIDSKTKRKTNEAQAELLGALTGGLSQVFTKALNPGAIAEIDAHNAVEAEYTVVEEEEGDEDVS